MSILMGEPLGTVPFTNLVDAFDITVTKHGEKTAVIRQDGSTITFKELAELAAKLATLLTRLVANKRQNTGRFAPILLAMRPGEERIIAILAIWKMRSCYVPVEPCVPKNRIKIIIRQVKPCLVLTDESLQDRFTSVDMYAEGMGLVVDYDRTMSEELKEIEEMPRVSPDDPATIVYTSGSTGTPKGVISTHRNILSRFSIQWSQRDADKHVGIVRTSLLVFDSVTEFWPLLLKGCPSVVLREGLKDPETLIEAMRGKGVTRLVLVPALLKVFISYMKMTGITVPSLQEVVSSGDRLTVDLATEFFRYFRGTKLINFYGSTEMAGDATCAIYKDLESFEKCAVDGIVSIGRPIDGVRLTLINDGGDIVKVGEIGEIVIEGQNVSPGYVGLGQNDKEYRTGDYGRIFQEQVYFLGRKDEQVKIRGYRIDYNEIRNVVTEALEAENVVVMAVNVNTEIADIVVFIETDDNDVTEKAKTACEATLPSYMMPKIKAVSKFPVTDTAKPDRPKLEQIYNAARGKSSGHLHPQDDDLEKFLDVVAEELVITPKEDITLDEEFVNLGGNSVNKVRIASSLSDIGFKFNFKSFMNQRTIIKMYETIKYNNEVGKVEEDKTSLTEQYDILQIDSTLPRDEINQMVLDSFQTKDPQIILALQETKQTADVLKDFIDYAHQVSVQDGGAIAFRRKGSDKNIGVLIMLDKSIRLVPEGMVIPEALTLILEILDTLDAFFPPPTEGERVLYSLGWATDMSVDTEENIKLTQLAEEWATQFARKRGYNAIHTENINPVTQVLAERLGYVTLGSLRLRDFTRHDGSQPFKDTAPADHVAKAMIKYL